MHHLHFRYVAEQPKAQTLRRLFQLLDDVPADLRDDLLRDLFIDFEALSVLGSETDERIARYGQLKSKLQQLARSIPDQEPIVYGLVCFILGNAHARHTIRLPRLIDQKRGLIKGGLDTELESLQSLAEEQETLRKAYATFCELVVGPLLGGVEPIDFGSEWAFDDSDPLPPAAVKERLAQEQEAQKDQSANIPLAGSEQTSGGHGETDADRIITSFLDHLSSQFELSLKVAPRRLAVRVADTAVSVSVGEYSAPSEEDPTRPLILRFVVKGLSPFEPPFRRLGLPANPKYHLDCRLEFSVFPAELALLPAWTAQWIRGQESRDPKPPSIPVPVDSDFDFTADASDWLSIDYVWSKSAREAYRAWEKKQQAE